MSESPVSQEISPIDFGELRSRVQMNREEIENMKDRSLVPVHGELKQAAIEREGMKKDIHALEEKVDSKIEDLRNDLDNKINEVKETQKLHFEDIKEKGKERANQITEKVDSIKDEIFNRLDKQEELESKKEDKKLQLSIMHKTAIYGILTGVLLLILKEVYDKLFL